MNLCMHYQVHSCRQDWQMMWVELKIISHWPLRFLACPPLPSPHYVWCCFIRWLRTGLLARQLKLAVGICNWILALSSLKKGWTGRSWGRAHSSRVQQVGAKFSSRWENSNGYHNAKTPHNVSFTHTHTHKHSLACRMRVCFFFFYSNNDSKFV